MFFLCTKAMGRGTVYHLNAITLDRVPKLNGRITVLMNIEIGAQQTMEISSLHPQDHRIANRIKCLTDEWPLAFYDATHQKINYIFHQLGPLGRVGLVVAMSVCRL